MAAYGRPELNTAEIVGIDPKTLRKHYAEELEGGGFKASTKVAENLYRKATGEGREAVTAAIFSLKARAGWKETSTHELAGHGGRPNQGRDLSSRRRALDYRWRAPHRSASRLGGDVKWRPTDSALRGSPEVAERWMPRPLRH